MSLLPMEAATTKNSSRFHEKHRLILVIEEVGAELVGEAPSTGCGDVRGRRHHDILVSDHEAKITAAQSFRGWRCIRAEIRQSLGLVFFSA